MNFTTQNRLSQIIWESLFYLGLFRNTLASMALLSQYKKNDYAYDNENNT